MRPQDHAQRLQAPDDVRLKIHRLALPTLSGELWGMRVLQARPLRYRAALWLMLAYGFASFVCLWVWARQLLLQWGHDAGLQMAIATAVFGGVAVGALMLGPVIHRSARPERWYVACASTLGLWGLVLFWGMAPACSWMIDGVQAHAALLASFFSWLPAENSSSC